MSNPHLYLLILLTASVWLCWLGSIAHDHASAVDRAPWLLRGVTTALLGAAAWWLQWHGRLGWPVGSPAIRAALGAALQGGALLLLLPALSRQPTRSRALRIATLLASWLLLTLAAVTPAPLPGWLRELGSAPDAQRLLSMAGLAAIQILALSWALSIQVRNGHRLAPVLRSLALIVACGAAWGAAEVASPSAPAADISGTGTPELLWIGLALLLAMSLWMAAGLPAAGTASAGAARKPGAAGAPAELLLDALTGLPSRLAIERELQGLVARCDRQHSRLAVLVCNLDGFSSVNASFGHDVGDQMLCETARRLRVQIGEQGVVGRIGADDFLVLLPDAGSEARIAERARALQTALAQGFGTDGHELSLSCSVGISIYPDHGGASRLLAYAMTAKIAAKRMGGACFSIYEPSMQGDGRGELDLLNDLRKALQRSEMELFFQPKIDAVSGQVTAAEALLRWHHPSRGMVMPAVFIPIAERFGLMRELGNWVIEAACAQAKLWREHGLRMRVAVNLSPQQMSQPDLVERIESSLRKHHIQPSLLTCEITETLAMENTQVTQQTFQRLGQLGVHLSIDDFGTGYSSLSYLRRLPAAEVKIDRAFVTDVHGSQDARAVVDAIVRLAHALSLRVVAEGVETQAQYATLLQLGCDELQGYLFAKPMSAQALLLWARQDAQQDQPAFKPSLFGNTDLDKLS